MASRCNTGPEAWPTELSYGMARRVEIARALAARPRLLLLDEPTAGMNHSERQEVSELMQKLRDEGLAQLIVEHDVQMMVRRRRAEGIIQEIVIAAQHHLVRL